jgi:hypothetical protein
VRAPGFEPWWVASHWTVLPPMDYKPNRWAIYFTVTWKKTCGRSLKKTQSRAIIISPAQKALASDWSGPINKTHQAMHDARWAQAWAFGSPKDQKTIARGLKEDDQANCWSVICELSIGGLEPTSHLFSCFQITPFPPIRARRSKAQTYCEGVSNNLV